MFAVVVRTGVVVVVFERHVLCAFGGQVSEARVECTFLANDAAYLTLSRAVTQLRRSEIVTPGVGLTVCVVCGVSSEKVGFGRAFSLPLVFGIAPALRRTLASMLASGGVTPHRRLAGQ